MSTQYARGLALLTTRAARRRISRAAPRGTGAVDVRNAQRKSDRVTNKQREFLQQHGFTDDEYFSNPLGDQMVAMLMMKLPATDDQMTYLKDVYKRDAITTPIPENLSRAGATKELDRLEMARPRLEWQEKKLRQCGIPSSEWPTNYWDCKAMYEARARPTPDSFDTLEPKARRMTTGTPL